MAQAVKSRRRRFDVSARHPAFGVGLCSCIRLRNWSFDYGFCLQDFLRIFEIVNLYVIAFDCTTINLERPCRRLLIVSLLPKGYLLCVNAHLVHLVDQLIWHFISQGDIDLLALAFTKDALCIFELSYCFGLRVVTRCYSDYVEQRIEHGLPEAPMRLPIVDKHLLDHLGRSSAAEAT